MRRTRLEREAETLRAMVGLACRGRHGTRSGLCPECGALLDYALRRLSRCPEGEAKAVCGRCPHHCYREPEKGRIRAVMAYAGPRILLHRPLLALGHLRDLSRRPGPRSDRR